MAINFFIQMEKSSQERLSDLIAEKVLFFDNVPTCYHIIENSYQKHTMEEFLSHFRTPNTSPAWQDFSDIMQNFYFRHDDVVVLITSPLELDKEEPTAFFKSFPIRLVVDFDHKGDERHHLSKLYQDLVSIPYILHSGNKDSPVDSSVSCHWLYANGSTKYNLKHASTYMEWMKVHARSISDYIRSFLLQRCMHPHPWVIILWGDRLVLSCCYIFFFLISSSDPNRVFINALADVIGDLLKVKQEGSFVLVTDTPDMCTLLQQTMHKFWNTGIRILEFASIPQFIGQISEHISPPVTAQPNEWQLPTESGVNKTLDDHQREEYSKSFWDLVHVNIGAVPTTEESNFIHAGRALWQDIAEGELSLFFSAVLFCSSVSIKVGQNTGVKITLLVQ